VIVSGLQWLDQEAKKHQARSFRKLPENIQLAVFDSLAKSVQAGQASEASKTFFDRLVYLFVGGFYTTREGMADIGYVGNVALAKYEGPSAEIRQRLGV
jgi:gluconate 2-dehydrogenase gamma chain